MKLKKIFGTYKKCLFKIKIILFSFATLLTISGSSQAGASAEDEKEIIKAIKLRLYPGGRDEEDLKVQVRIVPGRRVVIESQKQATESD